MTDEQWAGIASVLRWSRRELEVARLALCGVRRKEVVARLAISYSTVQTHLRRALRKARTDSVVALIWRIVEIRDQRYAASGASHAPQAHERLMT